MRSWVAILAAAGLAAPAVAREAPREAVTRTVAEIRRADYRGDRAELARLHRALAPYVEHAELGAPALYWRGFAMWRRAVNGFNETPRPADLAGDLDAAVADFEAAIAREPGFVDARIGAAACLGLTLYLHPGDSARIQELMPRLGSLAREAEAAEPDNPRLLWVLGPWRWAAPAERGGGQDKAFALYERGLRAIEQGGGGAADALRPSWGKPELLMSLAWSYLNRTDPDLDAAERHARAALELVPDWHYVKDILLPQIRQARAGAASRPAAGPQPAASAR